MSDVGDVRQDRPAIVSYSLRAVFLKNVHFQKRQKKTLFFQVCCPVLVMVLLLVVSALFSSFLTEIEWERTIEVPALNTYQSSYGYSAPVFLTNEAASSNVGTMPGPSSNPRAGSGFLGAMPQATVWEGAGRILEPHVVQEFESLDAMVAAWGEAREVFFDEMRAVSADEDEAQAWWEQLLLCQLVTPQLTTLAFPPSFSENISYPYYPPGTPCQDVYPLTLLNAALTYGGGGGGGGGGSESTPEFIELPREAGDWYAAIMDLPIGGVYMEDLTQSSLSYVLMTGDLLDMYDSNFDQILTAMQVFGFRESSNRFVFLSNQLHNAFGRFFVSDQIYMTGSYREMPRYTRDPNVDLDIASLIAGSLFPFVISILIPLYVQLVVVEKELRLKEMMKMMGMRVTTYWVVNYAFHYTLHLMSSVFFIASGAAIGLTWFRGTAPVIYLLFLFLWGFTSIGFAYFLAAFFGKSLKAMVFSYVLMIASIISSNVVNQIVFCEDGAPLWFVLYPPFAAYRVILLISVAASQGEPLTSAALASGELPTLFGFLAWQAVVFLVLSFYLDAVLPKKYGIVRPWHFPLTDLIERVGQSQAQLSEATRLLIKERQSVEDSEVAAERSLVAKYTPQVIAQGDLPAILIQDLHKEYDLGNGRKNVALCDPSFKINYGECFGLLGPNGAGKSTLISILTGLYMPTAGDAYLGGLSIRTHMTEIHHLMGVCPQHDTLWSDLTVRETLLFYARLKGVPRQEERQHVQDRIDEMQLTSRADYKVKELSGGMMRRLSIGIALTGSSKIIFLDEPTTGLDPETKHEIWKVITEAKKDRCILLTTHSMEEADVLCTRIGILSQGSLACIGPQQTLKTKFGAGFKLKINAADNQMAKAQAFVKAVIPQAKEVSTFQTTSSYQIDKAHMNLAEVFDRFDKEARRHAIVDWGVSQTSLEEVFFAMVSADEAAGR